jgi:hypothetical protein
VVNKLLEGTGNVLTLFNYNFSYGFTFEALLVLMNQHMVILILVGGNNECPLHNGSSVGRNLSSPHLEINLSSRGDLSTITRYDAVSREHRKEMGRARARHETVNGRFADFGALKNVWRHDLNKHYFAYCTIAIITQLETTNGFPPFECFSQYHSAIVDAA